jgi:hypothetical protein
MKVYPNQGIGPVRFGMTPRQAKEAMGIDEVYEDWMGGNLNNSLIYPGLIISFDRCNADGPLPDSKVNGFMANETADVFFNSVKMSRLTRDSLKNMIVCGKPAVLDHHLDIFFEGLGVAFGFNDDGSCYCLEMYKEQ